MASVSTVSYRFNVNGEYTNFLHSKKGITQGDPISSMLFVIIMEYIYRLIYKMQLNPNFYHHAKCENMNLTNLIFPYDVLLFCIGDAMSIEMMQGAFKTITQSTSLIANPSKSKMNFGGIDVRMESNLQIIIGFTKGGIPIRYLGVPLTCRKMNIHNYLPLIDKIVDRMYHWTTKLPNYAERIQLVKSITRAIAQYWMQ